MLTFKPAPNRPDTYAAYIGRVFVGTVARVQSGRWIGQTADGVAVAGCATRERAARALARA